VIRNALHCKKIWDKNRMEKVGKRKRLHTQICGKTKNESFHTSRGKMKKSTTFKGQPKPYGASGHFYEPRRHSLQARGIRTGSKVHLINAYSSLKPFKTVKYNDPEFKPFSDGLAYYKGKMYGTKEDLKYMPREVRLIDLDKDTDKDKVPDAVDCDPNDPTKQDNPRTFNVGKGIQIVAEYKPSRDGFNHVAKLYVDGELVDEKKTHYINRTWESYEYQSVMQQLVNKTKELTPEQKELAQKVLKKDHTDWTEFKTVGMIASLGEVFGQTKKEKNDWKERMIKAGLGGKGLQMPDDWDTLSENEKEKRLNKVIDLAREVPKKAEPEIKQDYGKLPSGYEYELEPRYDARQSFYGKANVRQEDGKKVLRSYNTDVAYIKDGKAHVGGTYSPTTLRHIKEFLKQNGFEAETSKQIMKDYGGEE
jgi:hypothetical protein